MTERAVKVCEKTLPFFAFHGKAGQKLLGRWFEIQAPLKDGIKYGIWLEYISEKWFEMVKLFLLLLIVFSLVFFVPVHLRHKF